LFVKSKLESDLVFGTSSNSGIENLYFRRTIHETKFPIPFICGTGTEIGGGGGGGGWGSKKKKTGGYRVVACQFQTGLPGTRVDDFSN
jgi:hypothetical protein